MASEKKLLNENVRRLLLKEYIMNKTERTGLGGLEIQRTPMGTRITLTAERPGMIIGRKGSAIKELTREVEEDFKFDNPQIEVQECRNPHLNSQIMAQRLASSLEKGWHFRRAGHSTVRRIMQAGAKGCQVILTGKLTGQRHRMEKFKDGHIKFCGEQALIWMDEGFATAKVKLGTIGVKVQIMDPNARLPDEIEVAEPAPAPAVDTGAVVKMPQPPEGEVPKGGGEAGGLKGEEEKAAPVGGPDEKAPDAAAEDGKEGEKEEEPEKAKRKRRKKTESAEGEEPGPKEKEGDDLPALPTKPEDAPSVGDEKKKDAEIEKKAEDEGDKKETTPKSADAKVKKPKKEKPAKGDPKEPAPADDGAKGDGGKEAAGPDAQKKTVKKEGASKEGPAEEAEGVGDEKDAGKAEGGGGK